MRRGYARRLDFLVPAIQRLPVKITCALTSLPPLGEEVGLALGFVFDRRLYPRHSVLP
jgi:hypothetical protein